MESVIYKESKGGSIQMINAAVLGSPISHSLSPRLHMSAYKHLNISGKYGSFDVPAGSLGEFLRDKTKDWTGFSLTMPLKEEVLSVAEVIDPLVKRIQSGNTLVRQGNSWSLHSTDVLGFQNAWYKENSSKPKTVLIVGSGATARAAAAAFDDAKFGKNADAQSKIYFGIGVYLLIRINTSSSDGYISPLTSDIFIKFNEIMYSGIILYNSCNIA
jgi:shikimate 5-dehydrogenase